MYHWLGWVFIVLGVGLICLEVALNHLGPYLKVRIVKKRLAKAKAKLVDAKLASEKQLTANIKEKEDEVKRAEAELAAAEAGIPDVILGLIKKLPWVVVVGFIFIYLGLTIIGAALPIKIRVG
jgi:hypothetical protein